MRLLTVLRDTIGWYHNAGRLRATDAKGVIRWAGVQTPPDTFGNDDIGNAHAPVNATTPAFAPN